MCDKTNDAYEKAFGGFEELLASSEQTHAQSRWERYPISELKVKQLPNLPLCISDYRNELSLDSNVEDDTIRDTMEATELVLEVGGKGELVRDTAVRGILSRARIYGSALNKLEKRDFCQVVNTCFNVWNDKALVLIRHGKVTALHAGDEADYSPLPVPELLKALMSHMDERFPGYVFKGGAENHEMTIARFEMPNQKKDLLAEYEKAIVAHGGVRALNLIPGLVFATSDTGNSGANVYALFCDRRYPDKNIRIGTALKLEHRSGANIEMFQDNLKLMFSKFLDQTRKLTEMLDIRIDNPIQCLKRISKKLALPAKQAAEAIQQYADTADLNEANAHELYMALYETAFNCKIEGNMSEFKLQEIEESLARALVLDWAKFDYPDAGNQDMETDAAAM